VSPPLHWRTGWRTDPLERESPALQAGLTKYTCWEHFQTPKQGRS